ncbi:uncharacterized protein PAC_08409 [Phialocephala subalpina]|uniref:Uncharacterized protein n=1 Tax=Phialocephala subalpina TaxID=576137 RepID=A0A1L7X0H4_9HELO|nr:uncharacterized protein PAC_08409 [Phialocephala subalpina]
MSLLRAMRGERRWQLTRRDDSDGDGEDDDCEDDCTTTTSSSASTLNPPPPPPPPPTSKPPKSKDSSTSSISSISSKISTTFSTAPSTASSTSSTSTSLTLRTFSSSTSFTPSQTTIFTTTSTSTTFSTLPSTSTQGNRGLASLIPTTESILSSATPTPSSAAQGIQDTNYQSNDGTGFFIGIGIAIGGTLAIFTALFYYMYKSRQATSTSTQTNYVSTGAGPRSFAARLTWGDASNHSANYPSSQIYVSPISARENAHAFWRSSIQPTPGPTVPGKSVDGDRDEKAVLHPDGLGICPVIHGPGILGNGLKVFNSRNANMARPEEIRVKDTHTSNQLTVSTSILRDSYSAPIYSTTPQPPPSIHQNKNNAKIRAVSAPISADVFKIARERELERELEIEKMGSEWESARKRGTGEPEGSVVASSEVSLPRWRDPISWVKDQRARMMRGREVTWLRGTGSREMRG